MEKFMFAFHGGKMPESPDEAAKIMALWGAWMEGLGAAMADPGSIVGAGSIVAPTGVSDDTGADPLSGYMIVQASDKAAAIEIAKGCPIMGNGGFVRVAPLVAMS